MKLVYIDVDSLRPDHVGAYGYGPETTPRIDDVAGDGVVFENAYAANSPCMPSRAGFVSGRYGLNNGVETHGPMGRLMNRPSSWEDAELDEFEEYWSLPELFFEDRTTTGAVSSFPRHPSPWFYHVWHEFHQPQEPEGDGESFQTPRAEDVVDLSVDFLERNADDDFFLYMQLWDPHEPYERPDDKVERFRDRSSHPYPTADQIEEHGGWDAWRSASQMDIDNQDDLEEMLAAYDAQIRYADREIGRVIDWLRDEDMYDETMIVVTADHGEEFGEHGVYREHWSTHEGTQRVPLIVKPPGEESVDAGMRDMLVTNVDMAPTLADYAGLDAPTGWQGRSLRPVLEDSEAPWRDAVVVDHGLYTAQRAVRTSGWKLIKTFHPGMWGGVVPETQLYDMRADPWEQDDVSDDNPAVVSELEEHMAEFVDDHVGRDGDALMDVADAGPFGSTGGIITDMDEWDGV